MTDKELVYAIGGICSIRQCVDCPLNRESKKSWCLIANVKGKMHPEYSEAVERVEEAFELLYDEIFDTYKKVVPKPKTLRLEEDDVMSILRPPEE